MRIRPCSKTVDGSDPRRALRLLVMPTAVFALGVLLTVVPALGSLAGSVAGFHDVAEDHPYTEAVAFARERGIVEGYEDGSFRPDTSVNRAEFVKILMGFTTDFGEREDCLLDISQPGFVDAEDLRAEWFGPFLCAAWRRGVVHGNPDGTFRPERSINAAETAAIVARAFRLESAEPSSDDAPWYEEPLRALMEHDALPPSVTAPEQALTRSEMVEIFRRLLQVDATHQGPRRPSRSRRTPMSCPR